MIFKVGDLVNFTDLQVKLKFETAYMKDELKYTSRFKQVISITPIDLSHNFDTLGKNLELHDKVMYGIMGSHKSYSPKKKHSSFHKYSKLKIPMDVIKEGKGSYYTNFNDE
jgi:hypothetical protein